MTGLKKDRILRSLQEHSPDSLRAIRDECNRLLGESAAIVPAANGATHTPMVTTDDLALLKAGAAASIQNADYKRIVENWYQYMNQIIEEEVVLSEVNKRRVAEEFRLYNQQFKDGGTPAMATWVRDDLLEFEDSQEDRVDAALKRFQQSFETKPIEALRYLLELRELRCGQAVTIRVMKRVRAHSDDPHAVCFDIWKALQQGGGVHIETVNRLGLAWIKDNISPKLGSHMTLKKALEAVAYFRGEGALPAGYTRETVRKYEPYLDRIKQHARGAPPDWKATWPDVLEDT